MRSPNTKKPPCFGQTQESVEAWLRANVKVGTLVAIRNTQGGFLQYIPAKVVRIGRGRFEVAPESCRTLSGANNSFFFSGKNCWQPKGRTRLVIPNQEILGAVGDPGKLGVVFGPYTV